MGSRICNKGGKYLWIASCSQNEVGEFVPRVSMDKGCLHFGTGGEQTVWPTLPGEGHEVGAPTGTHVSDGGALISGDDGRVSELPKVNPR